MRPLKNQKLRVYCVSEQSSSSEVQLAKRTTSQESQHGLSTNSYATTDLSDGVANTFEGTFSCFEVQIVQQQPKSKQRGVLVSAYF